MINFIKNWFFEPPAELSPESKEILSKQKYLWILDPGHGALTKGKRSPVTKDGRQLLEYEFNFDVAKMIQCQLWNAGIKSIMTIDDPANVGNALFKRVSKANSLKSPLHKVFVSIHGNAGPDKGFSDKSHGIETFYFSPMGKIIAEVFQKELISKTRLTNRGVKKEDFYVLRYTDHPAILTENGFFTNPKEFELMMTKEYRKKVADAHVAAIQKIENLNL